MHSLYCKYSLNLVHRFKSIILLIFLLTVLMPSAKSSDTTNSILYQEIFGLDADAISSATETIIAPITVLGVKKGNALIKVNLIMDIVAIERKPLSDYLKPYLKPIVFQQLESYMGEFIPVEELPEGVSVFLDENLAVVVEALSKIMKDIDPNLSSIQPKIRGELPRSIASTVNDFNINLKQTNGVNNNSASIDSTFRINRFLVSGSSYYQNKQATFFDNNWVTQYEDTDKSYYWGNIQSPVFADLNSQKITAGLAVGNTDLRKNIIFESDARYISLVYPADIKIYIDDVLHEEKSLEAGEHRLNIPSQMDLFKVRVEITDIYGRFKEYDFSTSGLLTEKIPIKGSYAYFLSAGNNENKQRQVYAGINWGIDSQSKASSAVNYKKDNLALALQYYRILPLGGVRTTLTTGYKDKQTGHQFNTEAHLRLDEDFSVNLEYKHRDNLAIDSVLPNDTHLLSLGYGYRLSDKLNISGNLKHYLDVKDNDVSLSARYQFNTNLYFSISHTNNANLTKDTSIGFNWNFPDTRHYVSSKYNTRTDVFESSANYQIDQYKSLSLRHSDDDTEAIYNHKGDIFDSKARINRKSNKQDEYQLETRFSIVSADDSLALSPSVGSYYGFGLIKADEDFIGTIGVDYQGKSCELSAQDRCVFLLNPEEEENIAYQLAGIPIGVSIEPKELSVFTPTRGGVNVTLTTHKKYFVEGKLINKDNEHVDLLIGIITDKNNKSVMTFTDDDGVFFAELAEGEYKYKISGFQPMSFSVRKEDAKDSLIDVGQIILFPEVE